ncbi:unnamed protein product [Aphis gossypii]|uniref:Uncharacterized protein n=1 Tax=Aphis gossypii TaxID=80765 RepID=A0A9P0J6I5_APHGO|nr:unnamed protein product [Aphis gossypii]
MAMFIFSINANSFPTLYYSIQVKLNTRHSALLNFPNFLIIVTLKHMMIIIIIYNLVITHPHIVFASRHPSYRYHTNQNNIIIKFSSSNEFQMTILVAHLCFIRNFTPYHTSRVVGSRICIVVVIVLILPLFLFIVAYFLRVDNFHFSFSKKSVYAHTCTALLV